MMALLRQQPRPFFVIFMLEIWERFGFYTVQGLLVLYFVRSIGFSHQEAYVTFGTFCALIYGMVPLGGYLGDKLLGTKRTIVAGLFVLMTGYALLALQDEHLLYISLAFICVGAALFKSNPAYCWRNAMLKKTMNYTQALRSIIWLLTSVRWGHY